MFVRLEQEGEFDSFLTQNRQKVRLVKFSAEWCPPCHELQKNLGELEKAHSQLAILEVDVEKFASLAQRPEFQVSALPTLLLFRPLDTRGEKRIGLQSLSQLKEWVGAAR